MHLVDTTNHATADLMLSVFRHIPATAQLGRLVLATSDELLAADGAATMSVGVDDQGAWRYLELPDGLVELTRWRDRVELSRVIG